MHRNHRLLAATCVALSATFAAHAQLAVTATVPPINGMAARGDVFIVTFDRVVDMATVTPSSFYAFGKVSGLIAGDVTPSGVGNQVLFTPHAPLATGENVVLIIANTVKGTDGSSMRPGGFTLPFMVAAEGGSASFCTNAVISTKSPSGAQTRIYGGQASDLNRDGYADLTIVNEVSADLRVFLSLADGTGSFGPLLQPPTPIPVESSPNEPADFNRDGFVDVVTSSNATNQIAIAMGNGDGTFDPPTIITVGSYPRGFGILDFDGDGDMDIAVANTFSNNIALLTNDGLGNFSAPTFTPSPSQGPYGMTAADANNDGLLDLVVGHINNNHIATLLANGNGTFTPTAPTNIGGKPWVIVCADLNGDGNIDASAGNSSTANASVALGQGNGSFGPPAVVPAAGHVVSTDLADVDGDGDIDWLVSSFSGGEWYLYLNDGNANFTLHEIFPAAANPACALPLDIDNDGDMDLALLDEIADLITIIENRACPADCDCSGSLNIFDYICFGNAYSAQTPYADCDNNNTFNVFDYICFGNTYAAGCP